MKNFNDDKHTGDIICWLWSHSQTRQLENVDSHKNFQKKHVDLIWTTNSRDYYLHIQSDLSLVLDNFYFEIYRNWSKGEGSSFMKTEADWLLYYFVMHQVLYWLPMPMTRKWFFPRIAHFRRKATKSSTSGADQLTTEGYLVPVLKVQIPGVRREKIHLTRGKKSPTSLQVNGNKERHSPERGNERSLLEPEYEEYSI